MGGHANPGRLMFVVCRTNRHAARHTIKHAIETHLPIHQNIPTYLDDWEDVYGWEDLDDWEDLYGWEGSDDRGDLDDGVGIWMIGI